MVMEPAHSSVETSSRPASPARSTRSFTGRLIVASCLLAGVAAFFLFDLNSYLSLDTIKTSRDRLLAFTGEHYLVAVLIFIVLYVAEAALSLPGAALFTLTGGFLFGTIAGALYANIGATGGAALAFLSARYLFHDWVEARWGRRLAGFQRGFVHNAFGYLITLRLMPIFPFFIINLLTGLTKTPLGTFVAATSLGIIPGSLVYAYAGRQLGTINRLADIASPRVLLAFTLLGLLALAPTVYRHLTGKRSGSRS
jgi:uncharacterized membrane protein YdjX (TVP38/TMEM64 family)